MMKIKIQTIANRVETTEESKETDERLDKERSQVIEAALVRIMKNRKQMLHSELVNEVTAQLSRRFTPKTTMVKLAMERLIEREYLERDDKDRKLLRYLVSGLAGIFDVLLTIRLDLLQA
jgi:cullin 3